MTMGIMKSGRKIMNGKMGERDGDNRNRQRGSLDNNLPEREDLGTFECDRVGAEGCDAKKEERKKKATLFST